MKKIVLILSAVVFCCGFKEYGAFKYEDSPFNTRQTEQFDDKVSKEIIKEVKKINPQKAKIERVGEQQKQSGVRKLKGR
uniref:Uncharacterized protein n=1 Tax=Dulem virus 53 TaxID=3145764 RepID=A0AAU8B4U1_9VIRU